MNEKKPKIAIVGVGGTGAHIIQNLAQENKIDGASFHVIDEVSRTKYEDNINKMVLFIYEKTTLEVIEYILRNNHDYEKLEEFKKHIKIGDEFYLSGPTPRDFAPTHTSVTIKRDGRHLHRTCITQRKSIYHTPTIHYECSFALCIKKLANLLFKRGK